MVVDTHRKVVVGPFHMKRDGDSVSVDFDIRNPATKTLTGVVLVAGIYEGLPEEKEGLQSPNSSGFSIRRLRQFNRNFNDPEHKLHAVHLKVWDAQQQVIFERQYPFK